MTITLYDLAGADPERRFSPYCWRTKLALIHKGLAFETVPWRFSEKDAIAFSGQGRVPVLVDGDRVVSDSWTIAEYLDHGYPDRPSLFGGEAARAAIRFVNTWADSTLLPAMARLILIDVFHQLDERDKPYFRQSREERYGRTLDALCAGREARVSTFRDTLQPLRLAVRDRQFLGGEKPSYADIIVLGSLQWARVTSPFALIAADDPVAAWRERMFDAFPAARDARRLGD
ncbi:MAG: glutathione S-transferase family protein [Gemmatimonas sp.]